MRRFIFVLWSTLAILGMLAIASPVRAGEEPYQQIRVSLTPDHSLARLLSNHNIQLMDRGDERQVDVLSRPSVTEELILDGWTTEVIHPDLASHYASLQGATLDYGVWHTYQETIDELNLLHAQYPNITTAPISLGTTGEERDIWAIKVSDHPDIEEADESEVLYDGVHHAREIMTVEMCLYFARYLCENYGTDPVATFLVDNRQVWFVPIVNPDGFVYNEDTYPDGGGMWRKNRRPGPDNCFGVDNNRNYPFEWGGNGSSANPCDDDYRGPSAGSEPENQALMNLVNAHHFLTHNSWHSVAGMHLIPWGYTAAHTPDDARLRTMANEMARDNGYTVGQAPEILYSVNGGMTDWMYGAQTEHPKVFTFSTEISGSGFWPAESEREGLLAENLHSILYTTEIAGTYVTAPALEIAGGDGQMDPGDTIDLVATVRNDGLSDAADIAIRMTCDDPYVVMIHASDTIDNLIGGEIWRNEEYPFRIQIEPGCPIGRSIAFMVITDGPGDAHNEVPFTFQVGALPTIYANDFESSSDWVQDATHTAATGAFVRIDPVGTDFQPEDDTTPTGSHALVTAQNPAGMESIDDVDLGIAAIHSPDFDLTGVPGVRLSMNYFHGQRDAGDDGGGDFFRIDVSSNGGANWVSLVAIGDVTTAPQWRNLTVELGNVIPLTGQVRLRVQAGDRLTNVDTVEGGIDDVYLYSVASSNQPPTAPTPISPPDGGGVESGVALVVGNATDPEGDPLTYGFRVYADPDLTNLVATASGIAPGATTTSWQIDPPLESGAYFWRAYAEDATHRGLYGPTWSFYFRGPSDVESPSLAGSGTAAVEASPNPASAGVRIRYLAPASLTSRLGIYDAQGRLVRDLRVVPSASGWREILWDGMDEAGQRVPSGSYWVRLWTPGETRTVRLVRID